MKVWTIDTYKNLMDLEGIMLTEKKSIAKRNLSHGSISITLSKWQNYRDGEQNSGGMGTRLSKALII